MGNEKIIVDAVKEVGKKVYKDVAQSSARNVGDFFGTLSGFFNHVVVYPLKKLNIKYEQKIIAFKRKMKEEYENIPVENRIEPELHIVGPTLESLKYNILDDDLAELFSNLLISDLDNRTQKNCSPAFVKIIEQLSPIDAKIYKTFFELISTNQYLPICKIKFRSIDGSNMAIKERYYPKNILNIDFFDIEPILLSKSIEALSRLGLISIDYLTSITDESVYEELKNQKFIKELEEEFSNLTNLEYKVSVSDKGIITMSEFSFSFANVCLRSK